MRHVQDSRALGDVLRKRQSKVLVERDASEWCVGVIRWLICAGVQHGTHSTSASNVGAVLTPAWVDANNDGHFLGGGREALQDCR